MEFQSSWLIRFLSSGKLDVIEFMSIDRLVICLVILPREEENKIFTIESIDYSNIEDKDFEIYLVFLHIYLDNTLSEKG